MKVRKFSEYEMEGEYDKYQNWIAKDPNIKVVSITPIIKTTTTVEYLVVYEEETNN